METITVELDQEVLYQLMLMAHERDITFNQFINQVLREHLDRSDATDSQ